jgi:hypothetical protein
VTDGPQITPAPSEEETVAIVAAMEALWPKPMVVLAAEEQRQRDAAWRFSGRWWARPLPTRRDRPFR